MSQYISSKSNSTPTTTNSHSNPPQSTTVSTPSLLKPTAYGNDNDSVSTLGQYTTRKWKTNPTNPPANPPTSIPNTISHSNQPPTHSDDRSIGSISTLHTRINSIEGHYQELSGTMEHIKNMLNLIANPKTTQGEDPKSSEDAGQRELAGGSS